MQSKLTFKIVAGLLTLGILVAFFAGGSEVAKVEKRVISQQSGVKIIAFGDSLTAGYGVSAEASYPALLEAALKQSGHQVIVKNEGVSGETTEENLKRAQAVRDQNPDLVLLGIGGNDALRLLPVPKMRQNIEATIKILQSGSNAPVVVLLRMQAPPTSGLGYKKEFDAVYEELASTYQILLLPFFTTKLYLNPDYRAKDGIHFNEAGYKKVVDDYLLEEVLDILEDMTP